MREVANAITKASGVIILPHINPDADAMGSVYAVCYALKRMGKECRVVAEEEIPAYLNDYTDGEYEIYDCKKSYNADLCLCLDCGDLGRIGTRQDIFKSVKKVVSVDHHHTNTMYADINYVESSAPATGVIIYKLFEYMNIELDRYIAKHLYTAICGDTGNFKYSNVTPETFFIAGKLIEFEIEHWKISKAIFDTEDFNSMRIKGELSREIKLYCNGLVAVVCVDKEILKKYDANETEVSDTVDLARRVRGCEVAVSLKETDRGVRVSLRSGEFADVSKIAAIYGGGGHVRAAGFLVENVSISQLEERLVKNIKEHLIDLKIL